MGEVVVAAIAVVAIVLIAGMSAVSIVDKLVQAKRLRHEGTGAADAKAIHEITERQQMFEDRLRVLERIATDRGTLLADKIEALRIGAEKAIDKEPVQ
jgi:hypothetical protein